MQFRDWLITEMPMQWGNDLALFAENNNTYLCVYRLGTDLRRVLAEWDYDAFARYVFGVIELRDNSTYDTWEVDRVWTQPGYGPFMYLVGMTAAGPRGLAPNRVRSQVTPAAKEVWRQFYEGAGAGLVQPVPLPAGADHHEEPYMNYKYVIKSPVNINAMRRRSEVTFRRDRAGELRTAFYEMSDQLLASEMNKIYGQD